MKRRILEIIVVLFWFSQYCYTPFLPPHLAGMGASATLIGTVVGVYGFVQLVCRIPIGVAMGRTGAYQLAVMAACLCTALAALGTWFATDPWLVLACRALSGLGSSMWAAFAVLYNSLFGKTDTTRSMGNLNMFSSLGRLAAFIVGGLLANQFGYPMLFLLCVAIGGAGFLLGFFVRPDAVTRTRPSAKNLLKVAGNWHLLALGIITGIHQMMCTATSSAFVSNIAKGMGATNFELSLLSAITMGMSVLVLAFMVPLARHLGENTLIYASFIGMGLYCVGNVFASNIPVLCVVQVLGGVSMGAVQALAMAMILREFPEDLHATAISVFQALYSLGMTLGPVLMGVLVDSFSVTTGFCLFALLGLVGAVAAKLCLHMRGPQRRAAR